MCSSIFFCNVNQSNKKSHVVKKCLSVFPSPNPSHITLKPSLHLEVVAMDHNILTPLNFILITTYAYLPRK